MPVSSRKPASQANFIFQGTVQKLKAAAMQNVPVDDRTVVVRVEKTFETPRAMAGYDGQNITVRLAGRRQVKVGQQLLFHAQGWIFGDGIAVQSLSQEPIKPTHAALLRRGGDPVEHHQRRELRQRFDNADVVVSGIISSVHLPADAHEMRARRALRDAEAEPPRAGRISEHDPRWREAVIDIDKVHKGTHAKKQIVVRFPVSTDVRWHKAPKFQPGHQGLFMLHKVKADEEAAGGAGRAKAEDAEPEVYTALHPYDYQPFDQPGGIRALIEAEPPKKDE
jgi:hypothetical protein